MLHLYNYNGLPFYTNDDISLRNHFIATISEKIKNILWEQNRAWDFHQIESCSLIPTEYVNSNYTEEDVYFIGDLALKPETTSASYFYAEHLFNQQQKLPLCVYQASKSFRKEQDQATKHCRFKEFYQLEFQCIYSEDTKNDYQRNVIEKLANMFSELLTLPTRIVLSDRLPSYSLKTIDIEVFNNDKWMEISSVSLRNDFKYKPIMKNKEIRCLVLEIAIGLDRLIYNNSLKKTVNNISVSNLLEQDIVNISQ